MKSKQSDKKIKKEKLEERIKFFMNKQIPTNNTNFLKKQNNVKNKKYPTTNKDNNNNNINIHKSKDKSKKKDKKEKIIPNKNNKTTHDKKNENISSLSTQVQVGNELNINLNLNFTNKKDTQIMAIPIKKEIGKFVEPRFKLKEFQKLAPKFYKGADLSGNLSQNFSHEITNSEIEMLEIDEKVPLKKLEQLETNRIRSLIKESFPFHFLIDIEKCYQEISKDLKGNKNKNLDYKIKIAASYLSILMNEENIIYNLFFYNKNINQFLIRELCVFLAILFLNDFNDIKENDILDFYCCISYCHLNFIFLIMILVNKTNEEIFINKNNEQNNSYKYFQQCQTLIELNSDKIDQFNFEQNFQNNNKIIKSMILNLLTNLSYINEKISNNILQIFDLSKKNNKTKFKEVLNNHIRCNELINEKINNIIRESISAENKSNLTTDEEESENLPQPEAPYFKPKKPDDKREYCLVLDLDETLVHYFEDENEAYVKVRMGTENFIRKLSKYCEIAIFTASTQNYADIVINGLDCKDLIDYRLYREHTTLINGVNIKDLSKLGRDMNKIIIIDNIEENYQFQPNNGLNISDFEGDECDNELDYLLDDLLKLVQQPGKNVCDELPAIRKSMQKRYTNIS